MEYVTNEQFWEGMRELATDLQRPTTVNIIVPQEVVWLGIGFFVLIAVVIACIFVEIRRNHDDWY